MTKTNPINDLKLAMDAVSAAILKLAESKPATTSGEVTQPIKLELDYDRLGVVIAEAIKTSTKTVLLSPAPVQKSEAKPVKSEPVVSKPKAEQKSAIDDMDNLDDDLEPKPATKVEKKPAPVEDDLEPVSDIVKEKAKTSPKTVAKPVAKTVDDDDDDDLDVTFTPTDEEAKQARIQNYIDSPSKIREVIVQLMAKHRNSFVKAIKDRIEVTSIESLISEENIATTADVIVNFEDSVAA